MCLEIMKYNFVIGKKMKRSLDSVLEVKLESFRFENKRQCIDKTRELKYGQYDEEYYRQWLPHLTSPSAIHLRDKVLDVKADNAFGWNHGKKDVQSKTLLHWLLMEKKKYPRSLIIVQHGSFYEQWGIDSIFCNEFGGLKVQGDTMKMKTGTPLLSVQRLLDGLVAEGFICRIYEEEGDDLTSGLKKRKLKQVVSNVNPVYFPSVNLIDTEDVRSSKPLVYALSNSLLVLDMSTLMYTVHVGLSANAMFALILSLEPGLIYVDRQNNTTFNTTRVRREKLPPEIQTIAHIWEHLKHIYHIETERFLETKANRNRVPLLRSTSTQLGITFGISKDIPSLISSLLGKSSSSEKGFLRNWILVKPTTVGRIAMKALANDIMMGTLPVAMTSVLNPKKIFGLLSANGVCKDSRLFHKINKQLTKFHYNQHLYRVTIEYTGLELEYDIFKKNLDAIMSWFDKNLVLPRTQKHQVIGIEPFLEKNETRILKHPLQDQIEDECDTLQELLQNYESEGLEIAYNSVENELVLFSPSGQPGHNFKLVSNKQGRRKHCYTTDELQLTQKNLVNMLINYKTEQLKIMRDWCIKLTCEYGETMRLFLQAQVISKTVHRHLAHVVSKGWNEALVDTEEKKINIQSVFPHWLPSDMSTLNDVNMDFGEIILLTAPNAHGKTTLIRSIMITAILAHAGLYVPAKIARLPEFTRFFLRLGSSDRPAENLSSFEAEILDLQMILKDINSQSLICLDELARSTSPKEAMAISQSLIEYLKKSSCYTVFSTHLHALLDQGLDVTRKTMTPEFLFADGECRNSLSLSICQRFNIPDVIIERATELLGDIHKLQVQPSKTVIDIANRIIGILPTHVPNGLLVPPFLTRTASVYIMKEEATSLFYIGESKHVVNRQYQHDTSTRKQRNGHMWIYPVANKTDSLHYESLIIKECVKQGILLSSVNDGQHSL